MLLAFLRISNAFPPRRCVGEPAYEPQSLCPSAYELRCSEQNFDERRRAPQDHSRKPTGFALLVSLRPDLSDSPTRSWLSRDSSMMQKDSDRMLVVLRSEDISRASFLEMAPSGPKNYALGGEIAIGNRGRTTDCLQPRPTSPPPCLSPCRRP